jgi:isoamylase
MPRWAAAEGAILSLGSTWIAEERAYNFSLHSRHASQVTLLLFGEEDAVRPVVEVVFDPRQNKTWDVWHCRLSEHEVASARYYAYRVDGPGWASSDYRHAYDAEKLLVDPYARDVFFPPSYDREAARRPGSNAGKAPLGVLPRRVPQFDWGDDRPPRHDSDAVIYEMHVRGFTISPTSGVAPKRRGTYAGVADEIPYLRTLGITMVELLPVQQFDPQERNYWGYMPLNFFTLHRP